MIYLDVSDPELLDHQIAWIRELPTLLVMLGEKHQSVTQVLHNAIYGNIFFFNDLNGLNLALLKEISAITSSMQKLPFLLKLPYSSMKYFVNLPSCRWCYVLFFAWDNLLHQDPPYSGNMITYNMHFRIFSANVRMKVRFSAQCFHD